MATAPDKWKHFERLVTAIHEAADRDSDVRWNEIINGRQFDVTIRFRQGLYEYLTVVECKDYKVAVPVEKVEAFVTKAADAHAHHAVMASTLGFQEGAELVARRHNMTLIHVTESSEIDPSLFGARLGGTIDVFHIQKIELEYNDGEKKRLPEEAHALRYYVGHVVLQCGTERESLNDLIQFRVPRFLGGKRVEYEGHVISCPVGTRVIAPDDGEIPLKLLASVHIRAGMSTARTLTGKVQFEPYFLLPDVKVRNVATGEDKTFSHHELKLGVDTTFAEGQFYEQPALASYYYCDQVKDDIARIYLVESFQLGNLIQAEFTVKTMHANYFVPVSDMNVIQRLQRRLERLKGKHREA